MPEGDTIHKLATVVRRELLGQTLREVRVHGQRVTAFDDGDVDEVFAVGKHLFVVAGTAALRTHLGMHGKWLRGEAGGRRPGAPWQQSVLLRTDNGALRCVRAKEAEVLQVPGQRFRAWLRRLGPDLGRERLDVDAIVERVRTMLSPVAPLVDALLDQRIASGIGNVYKCETLFLCAKAPMAAVTAIGDQDLAELFETAHALLQRNLRPGPRRTRASHPATHALRDPDDPALWVYGRAAEPCFRCREPIRFQRLGRNRRATWWCECCQPMVS